MRKSGVSLTVFFVLSLFFIALARAEENGGSVQPLNASFVFFPYDGSAPLEVTFTPDIEGVGQYSYSWDFNGDTMVDSTVERPRYTFEKEGEYRIIFSVTDSLGHKASKEGSIKITVEEANITLSSYFPKALKQGEQDVTFVVLNNGKMILHDLKVKVVGEGVQHLTSTSIESLGVGEEDSLTAKIKVLQSGTLNATVKIAGKNYPAQFTVAEEVQYNKEELQFRLTDLKGKLQAQEGIYYDKKAEEFLVAEIYDTIKDVKERLQDAEQEILTNKLGEAQVNLNLVSSSLEDISADLEGAKKKEETVLQWLKENAIAITAIIAALGTLSGVMIKVTSHAKKLGENVKQKMIIKRTITTEPKLAGSSGTQVVKEVIETSEGNQEIKDEKKGEVSDNK